MKHCPSCTCENPGRQILWIASDILKALEVKEVYAESDGYRHIDAFINVKPPEDFAMMRTEVVLHIAKSMPLHIFFEDPHRQLGEVVWMDEFYIALKYTDGWGNVWKKVELLHD